MQATKRFASKSEDLTSAYWDAIVHECQRKMPLHCWRAYMRRVYLGLLDAWILEAAEGGGLKTDLFEEALTEFNLLPYMGPNATGIDCSPSVVQAARERLNGNVTGQRLIVCDLRDLSIETGSIRYVLSGSSLDHFEAAKDFRTSLTELHRVLTPGGTAVITLDNPHNPVVWIRNHLPISWLNRLGVVPYYVGHTPRRQEVCRQMDQAGFEVMEVTSVAHAPRLPAVWLISALERLGWRWPNGKMLRLLESCEKLRKWPTRYWTGYYVAYRVRKRRHENAGPEPASASNRGARAAG